RSTQWNRRFGAETPITRVRLVRSLTVAALIEQPDPAGSVTDPQLFSLDTDIINVDTYLR
ncbi:MAG: hypothetical protein WBE26_05730, partial [Phycisphaerae bacterium]